MKQKEKEQKDGKTEEIIAIMKAARQPEQSRLNLDLEEGTVSEVDELKELLDKNFDSPTEKHDLYYNGIQSLINKFVPDKESRKFINAEKLIFLNRGKVLSKDNRRGSDSRMQSNSLILEVSKIVTKWAIESRDPIELFHIFYNLNEEYGYPHQEYDDTSKYINR